MTSTLTLQRFLFSIALAVGISACAPTTQIGVNNAAKILEPVRPSMVTLEGYRADDSRLASEPNSEPAAVSGASKDNTSVATASASANNGDPRLELNVQPLSKIAPVFPKEARNNGSEGYVTVQITISEAGSVTKVDIMESDPPGVFDKYVADAVKRWRFPSARKPYLVQQDVLFRINHASE